MKTTGSLVRPMAVVLIGAAGCVLTGCGAAAPAKDSANASPVGQTTPSERTTPPGRSTPAGRTTPTGRITAVAQSAAQLAGSPQRGIDINFYDGNFGPGNTVASESPDYVNYVKNLGANWLSITFPVFDASRTSSVVVRRASTPTPADLSILIKDAEAAGLSVLLRPLLDDSNLGTSRVHWTPPNLARWFATYQRVLIPYARMAQQDHVKVFNVGVEFDFFAASSRWNGLDSAIRAVYRGQLAFANNWDQLPIGNSSYGGRNVRQDVDAYPAFQVPNSASIAVLTRHWDAWASQLKAGTVLGEVGIPAQPDMYQHPYYWKSKQPNAPIAHYVQVRWFAAACNAVVNDHLGGIFFWSLPFGSSLTVPSGLADPGSWTATPGAKEIARCFSKLSTAR